MLGPHDHELEVGLRVVQTVYLHVGAGRCGSSSIQRFAVANRSVLAQRGILYPDPVEMGLPAARGKRRDNAWMLYSAWKAGADPLPRLSRYLDEREDRRFLLSSEFLMNAPTKFLEALIEALGSSGREVDVVGYVRNQPEWLVSRYAQGIKSKRFELSLEEYLGRSLNSADPDWLSKFERFEQIVGRDRLHPRLFERARLHRGDVRSDLFTLTGVEVEDLIEDDPSANSSPSVEELEAARLASAATDPRDFNPRRFLRHARRFVQDRGWDVCPDIYRLADPSLIRELRARFAPINERFRAAYFPDEEPPLFDELIPSEYEPLPASERLSARSLEILASYDAGIGEDVRRRSSAVVPARRADGRRKRARPDRPRASICAIAKNEASYLEEWVAYHHLLGFGPIRIYSHEPDDESDEVLSRLAERGLVEWTPWSAPPDRKPQWLAYEDGLASLRERSEWIAFIDLDEFVVIPKHETIQQFLADHSDFDAIAINWKMFGSSGHAKREPGLVIERFTRCARRSFRGNRAVKTLARTSVVDTPRVHTCHFTEGTEYKTVAGEVLPPVDPERPTYPAGESTTVTHDTIRIHHYFTRSREEWEAKAARGRGAKPPDHPRKHRTWREFDGADRNEERDEYLLGLAPGVKELIASLDRTDRRVARV